MMNPDEAVAFKAAMAKVMELADRAIDKKLISKVPKKEVMIAVGGEPSGDGETMGDEADEMAALAEAMGAGADEEETLGE